jgi:hypothetical protein
MEAVRHLLSSLGLQPVLVDVGASGAAPGLWRAIAPHAVYVGFDPDRRDVGKAAGQGFRRAFVLDRAVTAGPDSEVTFHLTRSPHCSSTLPPDRTSLAAYLFAGLFEVESTVRVPAATLDAALLELGLAGIDWLKLDSQGTDLRLFRSLSTDVRHRVLALDVEPGLIDAYVGEDLFVDAHRALTGEGFWLSRLNVGGAVRGRRETLSALAAAADASPARVERWVRRSPAWCEARYLRTTEWLAERPFARREYALLWSFALLDGQHAFALDVAAAYRRRFGDEETARLLEAAPLEAIRETERRESRGRWRRAADRLRRALGR